jgi:hypothetical protein
MGEVFSFGSFLCYLDIKREKNTASLRREAGFLKRTRFIKWGAFLFCQAFFLARKKPGNGII